MSLPRHPCALASVTGRLAPWFWHIQPSRLSFLTSPIKNDTAFLAPRQTVYTSAQDSLWCKGSGSNIPEKWKWRGPTVPVKVLRKALKSAAGLFPCECSPTGRGAKAHTVIRKQVIEQTWTEASDFLPSTSGFLKSWKNLGWALILGQFYHHSSKTLHPLKFTLVKY